MPTAFRETFETDGNGTRYTTSIPEFLDDFFFGSALQYFARIDDTADSGTEVIGTFVDSDGFWFGAMDTDGPGTAPAMETVTFTGIDISGLTNLNFSGSFAAIFGAFSTWEPGDQIFFEASIDGGAYTKFLQFASTGTGASGPLALDTDLDGVGDGPTLNSTFTAYSNAISGTGSTLDLRVTFENLNQLGEDFHIDNLVVTGDGPFDLAVDDLSTSGQSDLVVLDLLANDGVGTIDPITITSGGGANPLTQVSVTSAEGREGTAFFANTDGTLNFAFDPLNNFEDLGVGETDTVTISYSVTDNFGGTDTANVILTIEGETALIEGDNGDDNLKGTAGDDALFGFGGNDTIDGGAGSDSMIGGTGDDFYFVDDAGDVVVEASGEGYEWVNATVSHTLAANVEGATARGTDDIVLNGNDENNWLNGNSGNNILLGLAGNDRLQGRGGDDTLVGGTGNDNLFGDEGIDTFFFSDGDGSDVIWDFEAGEIIDLRSTSAGSFAALDIFDVASGAYVDYGTGVVVVSGVAAADLDASHFDFT